MYLGMNDIKNIRADRGIIKGIRSRCFKDRLQIGQEAIDQVRLF